MGLTFRLYLLEGERGSEYRDYYRVTYDFVGGCLGSAPSTPFSNRSLKELLKITSG